MKKLIISFFTLLISSSSFHSQSFDLTYYFEYGVGHKSWIIYNYEYVEFNQNANLDSSLVLESFEGTIAVTIDNSVESFDTTKYYLELTKEGTKIRRTFFDTLSTENIDIEYFDTVNVINSINEIGGFGHMYGWIFPDTLFESVNDTLDRITAYPYSRIFRQYEVNIDDSLFHSDDTLFIHSRPKASNINDLFYSIDYVFNLTYDVRSYSRHYSFMREGFYENYKFAGGFWVGVDDQNIPLAFSLEQNYPNPFNPETNIEFSIVNSGFTTLKVYDVLGREVKVLVNENLDKGNYSILFDGSDLSSGIYIYSLNNGSEVLRKKMLLLK